MCLLFLHQGSELVLHLSTLRGHVLRPSVFLKHVLSRYQLVGKEGVMCQALCTAFVHVVLPTVSYLVSYSFPGNRFESGVSFCFSELLTQRKLEKTLLVGNEDHLLNQAKSQVMKHEHQVGSLNNCIDELQKQAYAQRLELEDAHHGYAESRRETSSTTRRIGYERKSSSRQSDSKYSRRWEK